MREGCRKMKSVSILFLVALGSFACASSALNAGKKNDIPLEKISTLMKGEVTEAMLLDAFGPAKEIVNYSPSEEIWIYFSGPENHLVQRATFVISKSSRLVLTASWLPHASEPLRNKSYTLGYFKEASFNVKKSELFSSSAFSSELSYDDVKKGISFSVNPKTDEVAMISFLSKSSRALATE
jgi:hypothetical protein